MALFPPPGPWPLADVASAGFEPVALATALERVSGAETAWPRDLTSGLSADPTNNEPPPWNEVLGVTQDRGGPAGVLTRGGRVVGAWGDPARVDMTFSVAKSYLAVLFGVALGDGLVRSMDDRVGDYVHDGGFDSKQNRDITWRHLLNQTSEWEGTLFGKPDLIDRNRQVGPGADNSAKGQHRDLQAPGSFYEYNDVRVNRLSLSLMQVFGAELPEVLRTRIMDPIGAGSDWTWHAYRNSAVDVNGRTLRSVPGGSHWGGGLFMNCEDHARFGLLVGRDGVWDGKRLLPEGWVREMTTPSPCKSDYGALWWLNSQREHYPSAPASSVFAIGAGSNIIWVDAELDLVMVMRWIDGQAVDDVIGGVMRALG